MSFPELSWLYETAKKHDVIGELGSWKGRSSHALSSGTKGTLTCIDTWAGSSDLRDDTNWMAKQEDIFAIFKNNTKDLKNIVTNRKTSIEASKEYPDEYFDLFFIDAGHDFESVVADIQAWKPKVKKGGILCGHDFVKSWMGVIDAVNQELGKPDEVHDSIWVKHIK